MNLVTENKTFSLVILALVGAIVLMAIGKIPQVITVGDYTTLAGTLLGIYAAKSGIGKFAKGEKK